MKKVIIFIFILLTIDINISVNANTSYISLNYSNFNLDRNMIKIKYRPKFNQLPETFAINESALISLGYYNEKGISMILYNLNIIEGRDNILFKHIHDDNSLWNNVLLTLFKFRNDYIYEKEYNWYGLGYKFEVLSMRNDSFWHLFDMTFNVDMSSNQNSKILNDLDDKYLKNELCLFNSFALRYRYLNNRKRGCRKRQPPISRNISSNILKSIKINKMVNNHFYSA